MILSQSDGNSGKRLHDEALSRFFCGHGDGIRLLPSPLFLPSRRQMESTSELEGEIPSCQPMRITARLSLPVSILMISP